MISKVLKRANNLIKLGYEKSFSFKLAWKCEKLINNTITIEYGNYNNFVDCCINSIEFNSNWRWFEITATCKNGMVIIFIVKPVKLLKL